LHLLDRVRSLAATIETTLDLVAICDLDGVASYINPAGLQMLDLEDSGSGAGISLTEFVADADTETVVTISVDDMEVRVEIADKRPGIEKDELSAVFESFYRGKKARISRVAGTGLGLSIAKGFVEAQSGRIWAESTLAKEAHSSLRFRS